MTTSKAQATPSTSPKQNDVACLPSQAQAAQVGRKVLAGLEKARRIAHEQSDARVRQQLASIAYLVLSYRQAGRPERGLAGVISRKLGGGLCERQVRRYLTKISGRPL